MVVMSGATAEENPMSDNYGLAAFRAPPQYGGAPRPVPQALLDRLRDEHAADAFIFTGEPTPDPTVIPRHVGGLLYDALMPEALKPLSDEEFTRRSLIIQNTPVGKVPKLHLDFGDAAMLSLPELLMGVGPGAGGKLAAKLPLAAMRRAAATPAAKPLQSRSAVAMFDPPARPPRDFKLDYPRGVEGGADRRVRFTIDGQEVTAEHLIGRNTVGGEDVPLPTAEYDSVTRRLIGKPARTVAPSKIQGEYGMTWLDNAGKPLAIELSKTLSPEDFLRVYAHEIGHVVEAIGGQVRTKGLMPELKSIYNTLNNPNRAAGGAEAAAGRQFTPKDLDYEPDEVPREYIAEAVRAYFGDPNYIKTDAPKTAAAIREAFNTHPVLSRVIQFNTAAGLGLLPAVLNTDSALSAESPDAVGDNQAGRKAGLAALSIPPEYYYAP
jgi:hypothetical protein